MIEDRSWLEMAPDRLCEWPRACRLAAFVGLRFGDTCPKSLFVGLVPRTWMESPPRILPPTNSLAPLLCPAPAGRLGIIRGDAGDDELGECGELGSVMSPSAAGEAGAIGNEKAGRDMGPGPRLSTSREARDGRLATSSEVRVEPSIVSNPAMLARGRLPVAREYEEGADEGEDSAGNTKGGFGSGADRGDGES